MDTAASIQLWCPEMDDSGMGMVNTLNPSTLKAKKVDV